MFRESAAGLLRSWGFECETVDGPSAALAAIDQRAFDVVVTDLVMDGEVQTHFLEQVAQRGPAVLVVTAYPTLESAITAVDLGLVGYIPKPFESEELIERVERAVHQRRLGALLSSAESSLRQASDALEHVARLSGSATGGVASPATDLRVADQLATLTPREREIVDEFAQGYRLTTIARRLQISTHTVRRHLKSIFLKLEVSSQAELLEKLKP